MDFLQSRPENDPRLCGGPASLPFGQMRVGGVLATCTQAQSKAQMREGGVLANLLNPPDRAISDGPAHLRDRLGSGNENETN